MSSLEERHGKLAQLHPEDLLDKVARGTLTEDERERLDAHLAQCSACRMEQLLRADFEADGGGDRISYTSLVEGALGAVASQGAQPGPKAPVVPKRADEPGDVAPAPRVPAPAPWKRFALLFAAAFVLLATAAAASEQGRALARKATSRFTSEERAREKEPTSAPAAAPPKALAVAHAPEPAGLASAPGAEALPVAAPTTVAAAPAPPVAAPPVAAKVHVALVPSSTLVAAAPLAAAEPTPAAAEPPPVPVVAPEPDAAALFSRANDQRRAGNVSGALAAYGDLIVRFPSSREAATAHALRGRMWLEQREARRALSAFDAYLATGRGELREEAMVGRARALGMLGQNEGERGAWSAVLAAYPSSPSAEHARLRVQALAGR